MQTPMQHQDMEDICGRLQLSPHCSRGSVKNFLRARRIVTLNELDG